MYKITISTLLLLNSLFVLSQNNVQLKLDKYLKAYAKTYDLHGTILIAQKNKIVYQKAFGYANREWQIKNTLDTRFPIASLSKQFTAAAILKLSEEGKLSINDKLSKFFPNYPKGDSITIHMLLNHTSGIKEYSQKGDIFKFNNGNSEIPKDSVIRLFKDLPFNFSPGSFWSYSNTGYILLGYIIEQVSGQLYGEYINKTIFEPANMLNSGTFKQNLLIPKKAYGYSQSQDGIITQTVLPFNIGYSDGGLYSTVNDLFKWSSVLNSHKIISKESLNKMMTPNREEGGAGYGLFIDNFFGRKVAFHTGNMPGYSSIMIHYLNEEIIIIILTNRECNLDFLPKGLASIMFGKEVLTPYYHKAISLKKESLKKFTGKFEGSFPFEVIEKEGKLYMSFGNEIELFPESSTKLFISDPDVDIQIEYLFNKNEILKVYYIEGGVKTETKITK